MGEGNSCPKISQVIVSDCIEILSRCQVFTIAFHTNFMTCRIVFRNRMMVVKLMYVICTMHKSSMNHEFHNK